MGFCMRVSARGLVRISSAFRLYYLRYGCFDYGVSMGFSLFTP